jgi:hypothetical protein
MTVIYKTIDLKHKIHRKINNLQTLKLSKLVLILHYVCYIISLTTLVCHKPEYIFILKSKIHIASYRADENISVRNIIFGRSKAETSVLFIWKTSIAL